MTHKPPAASESAGMPPADLVAFFNRITKWRRPLLLSHARADGDAIGSLIALRSMFRSKGALPAAMLFEPPSSRYAWMLNDDPMPVWTSADAQAVTTADGIVITDTRSYVQLEPADAWLRQCTLPKAVIDHHQTGDDLADDILVDPTASATCLLIYEMACASRVVLDHAALVALFVGIATDTGWFRFSGADTRTYEAAAALLRVGVEPSQLHENLTQNERLPRMRMLAEVLATLETHAAGRLAVMIATRDAMGRAGAVESDMEEFVNYPLAVADVEVSVLLTEHEAGRTKVNFRSKPSHTGRKAIDVSAIAVRFGGGGHHRAAGARVPESLNKTRKLVTAACVAALG